MSNLSKYVVAVSLVVAGSVKADTQILESLPDHLAFYPVQATSVDGLEQWFASERLWRPGDVLKVCFFGGNSTINEFVADVATEWQKHANLTLDFGAKGKRRSCLDRDSGYSMVRVGFGERGYWSAVGTDSIARLNQYQPSMNLEGMDIAYSPGSASGNDGRGAAGENDQPSPFHKSVILHEFGHALGLLHEHQSDKLQCHKEIKWEGDNDVYDVLWLTARWNKEKVDRNLGPAGPFGIVDQDGSADAPDPDSLMMYSLPKEIFIRGVESPCYVPHRYTLSVKDIAGIKRRYPRDVSVPASVSDAPFTASDLSIAMAPSSPTVDEDMLARAWIDLSSANVSVRREARRQLAVVLQQAGSDTIVRVINAAAQSTDYRLKLGTVVALKSVTATGGLSESEWAGAMKDLQSIESKATDATLRERAASAVTHIKQWNLRAVPTG